MTTRDKIGVAAILTPLVIGGVMAYINVRDRLVRIETTLNNGLSHAVATHSDAITRLQSDLQAHLIWAEERSRTLQREVDRGKEN